MGQTVLAAVTSGLALAGVLAVGGVAAARVGRTMPHLGFAAVGAGIAVVAGRLTVLPWPLAVGLVALGGAAAGAVAHALDRRAREIDAPVWPPVLLPEVAVLALGVAIAAVARPAGAIDLPLGPLGGLASTSGAVAAGAVGIAFAVAVAAMPVRRRWLPLWSLASAGTAAAMALGAGAIAIGGQALVPAFGTPDIVGLAVRAVAVGVVARVSTLAGIAAAVVLGVAESIARSQWGLGGAAILPAVVVVGVGLVAAYRSPRTVPAA